MPYQWLEFPSLKEPFVPKLATGKTSEEMSQPVSHIKQSKQGCGSMLEKSSGKSQVECEDFICVR